MDFGTSNFIEMFRAIARSMDANRDQLCALDGVIGDADHGIAMQQGFGAVEKALDMLAADASPTDVFNTAAKAFLNAVGASSGPLYATAMMRAGAALKGKAVVSAEDVAQLIPAMTKGIADRGKAAPGDKTMLDAWSAASDMVASKIGSGAAILTAAAEAAAVGAEATKALEAKMGRAARLGARSVGHIDPGAASAALMIKAMSESLKGA